MIPTFGNTASVSEVVAALRSSGAAIVTSAASSELMQIVAAELRSGFDECALEDQSAFDRARVRHRVAIWAVGWISAARGLDFHQPAVHHAGRALLGALAWRVQRAETGVVEGGHAFGAADAHRGEHGAAAC